MGSSETAVGRQVRWVLERIGSGGEVDANEVEARFSQSFLETVPVGRIQGVLRQLGASGAPALEDVAEISANELTAVLDFDGTRLRMSIRVEGDEPHRIDGLLFRPDRMASEILDGGRPGAGSADDVVRDHLGPFAERLPAGGVVVGVVCGDDADEVVTFGGASIDRIFEIGSITKVFTGILLAEMTGRGEVTLEDSAQKFLGGGARMPREPNREITLFDLATHSSGLPRLPPSMRRADPDNPYADFTVDDLIEGLAATELEYPIGNRVLYSNYGYGLLGHVLGLAAGVAFGELVRERVSATLGLSETFVQLPPALETRRERGHGATGDVVPHWDIPSLPGAGALQTPIGDMLRFVRANLEPESTPIAAAIEEAQRARLDRGERQRMGFGWVVYERADGSVALAKTGGTGGFRSVVAFHRPTSTGVAVLVNCAASHPGMPALEVLADLIQTRS